MSGGGAGITVLETPTYIIALVFLIFLLGSVGIERLLHRLRHNLTKKGRIGLIACIDNMILELALLGLIGLLLTQLNSNISSICSKPFILSSDFEVYTSVLALAKK